MAYFPESSIIVTKDGLYCQVYSSEHPEGKIIVKPKYIPTDKISNGCLPCRFIGGRKLNRLDMWIEKEELNKYLQSFLKAYPNYILQEENGENNPLFFAIPQKSIDKIYSPKEGLSELMSMPVKDMDTHLKTVFELLCFLLKSGLKIEDFGITYSTLMGHYSPHQSDINIVVYGKDKFWSLMRFLEKSEHEDLMWKTYEQWEEFYSKRNRYIIHDKKLYLKYMSRKKSEGYFKNKLFIIFAVEEPNETWFKWGEDRIKQLGNITITGTVIDNYNSIVRPGYYEISYVNIIKSYNQIQNFPIKRIVFYSRDYCMLAYPQEKIEASGVLEEVTSKEGEKYYRIVVGYFYAHLSKRREKEYIKVLE